MADKQRFYVTSKTYRVAQYYQNLIKNNLNLGDFVINYNEYLLKNKNQIIEYQSADSTKLNLNYLLLNPIYEQLKINEKIFSEKPVEINQPEFGFNLGENQIENPVTDFSNTFSLPSQDAFIIPLDNKNNQFDTIIITYSIPEIINELNKLYEEQYFFLPAESITSKFKISIFDQSENNHFDKKISPQKCILISDKINQLYANKHPGTANFRELIKLEDNYVNTIFIPTYDLNQKFTGFVFSYSYDGYYRFYIIEFIKRSLAATLSLVIIFLLYYRNHDDRFKLSLQNKAILEDQENLKKAKELAEQANMIKSEFLTNMSHEIRTPMNTVLGFTDILSNQITNEQHKKYLEAISAGTKNLLVLINDILDLSKIEAGKLQILYQPADPRIIFKEIEGIFADKVKEKNLSLIFDIQSEPPVIMLIDEIRFRQILFNLIGNAIKFTDNGYIKITSRTLPSPENNELVDLIIDVEDSGIGIEAEHQEDIFNAFQQQDGKLNKKYGGSGLGLSISKKLATLMNGSISLVSTKEKGSTFTLSLKDIEVVETTQSYQNEIQDKKAPRKGEIIFHEATVLIVDDVDYNRYLLKEFLKNSKIKILEAMNGKQAVELAQTNTPDLILMDIRMPVMDGFEATKILKNDPNTSSIKIVALTASLLEEEIKRIKLTGFDHFLRKPIKYGELTEALAKYISHERKLISENQKPKDLVSFHISADTSPYIEEIIELLENDFAAKWKKVKCGGFIDEIANFGEQMMEMGKKYTFEYLISFGKELIESTESFDVNTMKKTLNAFPDLVESIKNVAEKQKADGSK
jgi:two-component system sensor histidine kinase EvgS